MTEPRGHHLAQLNVARLRAPIDSPLLVDFVAALDPVNALADSSPGFVWRLQTEGGNATGVRIADDESLIVNLTVWESLDALAAFVYRSGHVDVMRRKRTWFEPPAEAHLVLWWVPAGHRPDVVEAQARLEELRRLGPSARAFTFRAPFDAPGPDARLVDGRLVDGRLVDGRLVDGRLVDGRLVDGCGTCPTG